VKLTYLWQAVRNVGIIQQKEKLLIFLKINRNKMSLSAKNEGGRGKGGRRNRMMRRRKRRRKCNIVLTYNTEV
jgi:hypothetical protein